MDLDTFFKWVGYIASLFVILGGLYKAWQVGIKGFLEALKLWIARGLWQIPKKSLIVLPGRPQELDWSQGTHASDPAMFVNGCFDLTNLTSVPIRVLKSYLLTSFRKWLIPRSIKVEGFPLIQPPTGNAFGDVPIPPHFTCKAIDNWTIVPPIKKKGESLKARVCFVDQFGNEHWTPIVTWTSR